MSNIFLNSLLTRLAATHALVSIDSDYSTSVIPLTKCRVPTDQEGTGRDLKSSDHCIVEWADKKTYIAQIDAVGMSRCINLFLHI